MAKGLKIEELADGGVYECQLSGLPVLIILNGQQKQGYQYNPITGQYHIINIRDHQLKHLSK